MRLYSLRSITMGLVCLLAVTLIAPIIAPVLIVAALFVPGLKLMRRTNDLFTLNLASYHSPHRSEWSWCLSFIRPRSADEGRWLSCYAHGDDCTWRAALQIARCQIMLTRQLYHLRSSPSLAGRSTC